MNVSKSPRDNKAISLGVSALIVVVIILVVGIGVYFDSIPNPAHHSHFPMTAGEYQVTFSQIAACKAFPPAFWGTPWAVTINNTTEVQPPGTSLPLNNQGPVQSTSDSALSNITFTLADGTYSYVVSPTSEFFTPDSGNVTVAGSNVTIPIQYSGTSCTESTTQISNTSSNASQTASTSIVTAATTSTISAVSTTCAISGQGGGMDIRVLADSNSSPVVGARVYATSQPDTCNGTPATSTTIITFTTNGTMWYSLPIEDIGGYSFIVSYSGQNYTLSAGIRPVSLTCATLYIPSGHTNVTTTEFGMSC